MIKLRRNLTLLATSLLSIACSALEVAFFDADSQGDVYLHTSKTINLNDNITVLTGNQKETCCLKFNGRQFLKIDSSEQVSSDDDGKPVIRYKLLPVKSKVKFEPQVSAAVIGTFRLMSMGKDEFKLLSSFRRYVVTTCYGIEGRNLYLKSQGKQIQHLYYYFNYDIEPNCK